MDFINTCPILILLSRHISEVGESLFILQKTPWKLTYSLLIELEGECVTIMLEAIWSKYADVPNALPTKSGVTTKSFASFFLFWLLSLPALWIPVHKVRHLFTIKSIYSPAAAIGFVIWATNRAGGVGTVFKRPSTVHGGTLAWVIIKSIMQTLSNFTALIINIPDFARYAKTPESALWTQLITIPISFAITSLFGILLSTASTAIYGQPMWNPLTLLHEFLKDASSAERLGVFLIALGLALAQLGTNVAANSVSGGTNMAALLPRFINIRRGSYICAALSLAVCPVCFFKCRQVVPQK